METAPTFWSWPRPSRTIVGLYLDPVRNYMSRASINPNIMRPGPRPPGKSNKNINNNSNKKRVNHVTTALAESTFCIIKLVSHDALDQQIHCSVRRSSHEDAGSLRLGRNLHRSQCNDRERASHDSLLACQLFVKEALIYRLQGFKELSLITLHFFES